MATTARLPRQSNWKMWGGIAVAALIVLGGLGYWYDWFGTGATEVAAPVAEQSAPASE